MGEPQRGAGGDVRGAPGERERTDMTQTSTRFDAPDLRRLRYFHGQLLSARDFQREQEYFREKLKLRLRCLLGYGVVCGLHIEPVHRDPDCDDEADAAGGPGSGTSATEAEAGPPESPTGGAIPDAGPASEDDEDEPAGGAEEGRHRPRHPRVRLTAGLGVDCRGNEVIVHSGCEIDLWAALP